MKNAENDYEKENTKNCFECIHHDVCEKYNEEKKPLFKKELELEIDDIGKMIAKYCRNYRYRKLDSYMVGDFKEVLVEMINNCNNPRHLLTIHGILKLLEECKCQSK